MATGGANTVDRTEILLESEDRVGEGEVPILPRGAHRLPTDRHIRKDSMSQWKLSSFFQGKMSEERGKRGRRAQRLAWQENGARGWQVPFKVGAGG